MSRQGRALLAIVIGVMSCYSVAQPTTPPDMETVEVRGRLSSGILERNMKIAAYAFYEMYNKVNDKPEFDMVCSNVKITGTNIVQKTCEPRYQREARTRLTLENVLARGRLNFNRVPSEQMVQVAITEDKKASAEHLKALLKEHPALLEEYLKLEAIKGQYERAKTRESDS